LRREQVARETAAALRYRQLEEREQARQQEEREHTRLLEDREHARQVRQTRVETSPSNYVLLALVVVFCFGLCLFCVEQSCPCPRNRMKGKVTAPFRPPRVAHEGPTQIPYIRGIKWLSEREADETALYGEPQRWSTDSEEPTELGLVWDGGQQHGASENTYDLSPARASKDHYEDSELPSPHLADFESFLSIMGDKQRKSSRRGKGDAIVIPEESEGGAYI
jgi:hypothetical protein